MTHIFVWYKNGLYAHWHNRKCRIIRNFGHRSVTVEFENGEQCHTRLNALRRIKSHSSGVEGNAI
jgi:hypothetical protein